LSYYQIQSVNQATIKSHYDVIICGAGPAGCTCALSLAESGLKVALIDKAVFPRDKICGDSFGAYIPKVLNTLNPSFANTYNQFQPKSPIDSVRIFTPKKQQTDFHYRETGYVISRRDFDNFLLELVSSQTRAEIFTGLKANDIRISDNSVEVLADDKILTGKIIIGCDGATSTVRKKLLPSTPNLDYYCTSVRAYYKNIVGIPENTIEIHLFKSILPGYFWIFPMRDQLANVGMGIPASKQLKNKISIHQLFEKIITEDLSERFKNAELTGEIKGSNLPLWSGKRPISGSNFMLCGDAISVVDPLSGEGIGPAMMTGRYAGWQAIKCFEKNDFTGIFMSQYDNTVWRKFNSDYNKRQLIQRLLNKNSWIIEPSVSLALKLKTIHKLVQNLIS
jgi:menaquinone-9 beta-reductase